jgi:uncharacterized protein involved in outer membrane biogenesis
MRWKWVFLSAVFLVIALMVMVYAVLASYDYNKLKPRLAQLVKDATGRELLLNGDIKLGLGFSPSLVVTDAALANAAWGSQPQMITVKTLRLQVRLFPLLYKNIDVDQIGLSGVTLLLETGPGAKQNWDFLSAQTSSRPGASTPAEIDVDRVRIEDFDLTFYRRQTASKTQFTVKSLVMKRPGTEAELALKLRADYNGQAFTLDGTIGSIQQLFKRERFPVQLVANYSGIAVNIKGAIDDTHHLAGFDLNLEGSGNDLSVLGPIIGQTLPTTDQFSLKGQLTGAAQALSLKDVQGNVRRGSLHFTVNGAVQDFFTLEGMDLQSRLTGKDLTEFGDMIGVKLLETDEFEIQGRLTGATDGLALQAAKASAGKGSMRLSLAGTVKDLLTLKGMDLKSQLTGKELADLGSLADSEWPNLGPFDVSGTLSGSAQVLSLSELSMNIDKSDFKGQAKIVWHQKPEITLQLESSLVDFTALIESMEKDQSKPENKETQKQRLFSDDPLPFGVFQSVNADIAMKAENIQAKAARFKLGHIVLKLVDGNLSIDKFKATYKDTKLSGDLHINHGTPPLIATHFIVQDFDLGSVLKETGVNDKIRATIDIAAELKSRGDSVASLMAALDGTIGAVMGQGYLTRYLDMLSVDLSQKVLAFWRVGKDHLEKADQINCAVVQFDIKEGVATSRAFVFDSQALVLGGEGEINLGSEQIDFLLVPEAKDPSILSLTTNLRVNGSIMDPTVSLDKRSLLTQGGWALSSLAIGPVGLLAPFVHLGAHKAHPCDIKGIGQTVSGSPPKKGSNPPRILKEFLGMLQRYHVRSDVVLDLLRWPNVGFPGDPPFIPLYGGFARFPQNVLIE